MDRLACAQSDSGRAVKESLTRENGREDLRSSIQAPETSVPPVKAASAEVADDYLVFLHEDGTVSAFFYLDVVEGWSCDEGPSRTTQVE